jgi:hypothetical protein
MNEELTTAEKRELEISEFLREFASIISEKFTKQKDLIDSMNREISSIKNEDLFELRRRIEEIRDRIDAIDEKIPREEKISRDILDDLRE